MVKIVQRAILISLIMFFFPHFLVQLLLLLNRSPLASLELAKQACNDINNIKESNITISFINHNWYCNWCIFGIKIS